MAIENDGAGNTTGNEDRGGRAERNAHEPSRESPEIIDRSKDQLWWDNFRELLNDQYDWPAPFTFKFIAPKHRVEEVRTLLVGLELTIRASSKGSYHSITAVVHAESAEQIIATYESVGGIDGVVSL